MSIKSKIQNLIAVANEYTGEHDLTLTDAIQTLVDGYGGVTRYKVTYTLGTNIVSSNTASRIVQNESYTTTISTSDPDYSVDTITVTMGGVDITSTAVTGNVISIATVTGNVSITVTVIEPVVVTSISATFTQSDTVYDVDTLDSLTSDLIVVANWSDSTTTTLSASEYTLSGALEAGTSTITVTYGNHSDTFDVTVTAIEWQLATADDFAQKLYNAYSRYIGTKEFLLLPTYLSDTRQTQMTLNNADSNETDLKYVKYADSVEDPSKLTNVTISYPTIKNITLPSTLTKLTVNGLTKDFTLNGIGAINNLTNYTIKNTTGLTKIPQININAPITSMDFSNNTGLIDASGFVWPLSFEGGRALWSGCTNLEYASITTNQTDSQDMTLMFQNTNVHDVLITANNLKNTKWVQRYLTMRILPNTQTYAFWRDSMASEAMPSNINQFYPYIKPVGEEGRQILIWGDSLTRMPDGGEMPKKMLSMMADDVIVNNKGLAGISTSDMASNFTSYMSNTTQTDKYVPKGANDDINILFLGHNGGVNISSYDTSYMPWLEGERYMVSGLVQKSWSTSSEESLSTNYGDHYFNLHQYMIDHGFALTGLTPTTQDEADVIAGKVPHSFLRSDYVHLNEWGAQIVAYGYLTALLDMGYIDQTWLSLAGKNTSVTISSTSESINVGNTITVTAVSGNGADIEWKSTDTSIAIVEGGIITAVASGTCSVIARCGGYSKTCTVTVT